MIMLAKKQLTSRRGFANNPVGDTFRYSDSCHPEPQAKDLRLPLRVSVWRNFRFGDDTTGTCY